MDIIKKFVVTYVEFFIIIFLADLLIDKTFNIVGNLKGSFIITAIFMLFGYVFKKLSYK
ncbi:hypothetical protein [Senegalia massiliensis]|uniref:hypothetical protein n=1 Tax=Senegalia massiliensis TaxID=1720316 RepID=UPI001362649E|nr:hypothetical protein [Senegalia massiliensis]